MLADVQATSPRSIASDIHIIVNYPFGNAYGDWDGYGTIRLLKGLSGTDLIDTAAHEAFHAASYSPEGDVEHGLVYVMTALWPGSSGHWHYKGNSVTSTTSTYSGAGQHTANMIYRVFNQIDDADTAFEFVLDVDLRAPSSISELVEAMQAVAKRLGISTVVNRVLVAVGEIDPPISGGVYYPNGPPPEVTADRYDYQLYRDTSCRDLIKGTNDLSEMEFVGARSFTERSNQAECWQISYVIRRRPRD